MRKFNLILSLFLLLIIGVVLSSCSDIKAFSFNSDYLSLEVGDTVKSTDIKNTGLIKYFSIDETIAQIDNDGNVTGIGRGETVVYALFKNNPYKCNVRVTASTKNPDVYKRDVNIKLNSEAIGLHFNLPTSIKYNGKDSLLSFDESLKLQIDFDLLKTTESSLSTEEQAKKNVTLFYSTLVLVNLFVPSEEIKPFINALGEYNKQISELTGEELKAKINEIGDLSIYVYLSQNYLALALFSKGELKSYYYSNEEIGIISKLPKIIRTIKQIITSGIDLQKVDYIEIFKDKSGDLLDTKTLELLKKYQPMVTTLIFLLLGDTQINKSTIEEGKPDQRIKFTILESGLNELNSEIQASSSIFKDFKIISATAYIDITKNPTNNYNHLKNLNLTMLGEADSFDLVLDVEAKDPTLINDENPFNYENKHSEYEKTTVKAGA